MQVITTRSKMAGSVGKLTYQLPFALAKDCPKCKSNAKLIMLIQDDERLVASQRPTAVKVWPHDCMAVALYLCTECGEMIADWNQG